MQVALEIDHKHLKEALKKLEDNNKGFGRAHDLSVIKLSKLAGLDRIKVFDALKGRSLPWKTRYRLALVLDSMGTLTWPTDIPKRMDCRECGQNLALDQFVVLNANGKIELADYCLTCKPGAEERVELTSIIMPDKPAVPRRACATCGRDSTQIVFGKDKSKPDGYKIYCNDCRKAMNSGSSVTDIKIAWGLIAVPGVPVEVKPQGEKPVHIYRRSHYGAGVEMPESEAAMPEESVTMDAKPEEAPDTKEFMPSWVRQLGADVALLIKDRVEVIAAEESRQWEALAGEYEVQARNKDTRIAELEAENQVLVERLKAFDGVSMEEVDAMRVFKRAFKAA